LKADPKAAWGYANRAAAYMRRDDHKNALTDVEAAIKTDPGLAMGYAMRAIATRGHAAQRNADAQKTLARRRRGWPDPMIDLSALCTHQGWANDPRCEALE
jgi:hypothetical protein